MRAGGSFSLFHYKIISVSSNYLLNYTATASSLIACICKIPQYLHLLSCNNNTNVDLCELDNSLTRELTTFYWARTMWKKIWKIMEEHGVMELFRADSKLMRAVDGKQRIYLEWPYWPSLVYWLITPRGKLPAASCFTIRFACPSTLLSPMFISMALFV